MFRSALLRRLSGLPRWPAGGLVLLYHRVTELDRDPHQLAVTPAHFAEHLQVLCDHGVPMSLDSMIELAERRALPRHAVAVTFDDGYADNLLSAAPLLSAAKVPATMFVSTGAVESGREFWWDDAADRPQARTSHRPLSAGEIRELSRIGGITIGSHTETHRSLAALPPDDQRREIAGARRWLEELIGVPVTTFAYPFGGAADVSGCTERIAREEGITIACTNEPGSVRPGVNRLRVPRVIVRDWSKPEFLAQWRGWVGQ